MGGNLTKAYLQQSSISIEVPKGRVQIWKACKLNLPGHVLNQMATVRSVNFERQGGRDSSHCRYEAVPIQHQAQGQVKPSISTFYGRIQFYFSFSRQLLAVVRPFKVEVLPGNNLCYSITGNDSL